MDVVGPSRNRFTRQKGDRTYRGCDMAFRTKQGLLNKKDFTGEAKGDAVNCGLLREIDCRVIL